MANLSDLLEAINRLGERIGVPDAAAQVLQPSLVRALPSGQSIPLTADSIGSSVARHIGNMPVWKLLGQQLTSIAQTMRRTGSQTNPKQVIPIALPLPGTVPLPSTQNLGQRIANYQRVTRDAYPGGFDIVRLLATASSGTPIVSEVGRQALISRQLFKYLPSLDRNSSVERAREAFLAARHAGSTVAGATRAAGFARYAPMLTTPLAAASILAGSFTAVGAAVVAFGKSISNANRSIAGYSPLMSVSYAISDIRDIFRDIGSANRRAPAQAEFLNSRAAFLDKVTPSLDKFFSAIESLAAKLLDLSKGPASKLLEGAAAAADAFSGKSAEGVAKAMDAANSAAIETAEGPRIAAEKALRKGQADKARLVLDQMKAQEADVTKRLKTASFNWPFGENVQDLRDSKALIQGNIRLLESDIAHPENFARAGTGAGTPPRTTATSMSDIPGLIRDAIETIKELNKSLKGTGGGLQALPAGLFMAGVTQADTGFSVKRRVFDEEMPGVNQYWRGATGHQP